MVLRPSEHLSLSKPRLLRLLADIEAVGWPRRTVYLTPDTLQARLARQPSPAADPGVIAMHRLLQDAGESDTGLAVFIGAEQAVAIAPPFPLVRDLEVEGVHTLPLIELLNGSPVIGVVLLRLGRYAVGVLRGEYLSASKTGSRYVKSRHRAGGSSQRRYERSRERLVRELFDAACEVVQNIFSPFQGGIDYVLLGGEPHTLRGFVERCPYLQNLERKTLKRLLQVDRPGQDALENIAFEVWRSRVVTFDMTRDE